jgi:LAO/AO transport system kinase
MNSNKLEEWLKSRKNRKEIYDHEYLFSQIKMGDLSALARGITLIESTKAEDKIAAQKLIQKTLPFIGKSLRIGITGVPGVGKSTFIETFGEKLISKGKKIAVLAVDPTSEKTHGSILGDKTRMEKLSSNVNAFIRPSPAGDSLGGVARKTRESIYLCELAGFDVILVETVGVGQSETSVHSMVDFFLLLMLAGAGDELQGIKRGIMELADLLVVTKADGENIKKAKVAQREYQNALHLFPANSNNWITKAMISSVYNPTDIEKIIDIIEDFEEKMTENSFIDSNRKKQDQYWMEESLKELILNQYYANSGFKDELNQLKSEVIHGKISSFEASHQLFEKYKNTNGNNKL